jgi:hypothetical protein
LEKPPKEQLGSLFELDYDLLLYDLTSTYLEGEAAFRIPKSDLEIRPVWHQRQDRVEAHILVCFLAYVLWKTLAAMCRQAGRGGEPRVVFENLSELSLVEVVLPTRGGTTIKKRCLSQPTQHQLILLQRLGLRPPAALEIAAV